MDRNCDCLPSPFAKASAAVARKWSCRIIQLGNNIIGITTSSSSTWPRLHSTRTYTIKCCIYIYMLLSRTLLIFQFSALQRSTKENKGGYHFVVSDVWWWGSILCQSPIIINCTFACLHYFTITQEEGGGTYEDDRNRMTECGCY